ASFAPGSRGDFRRDHSPIAPWKESNRHPISATDLCKILRRETYELIGTSFAWSMGVPRKRRPGSLWTIVQDCRRSPPDLPPMTAPRGAHHDCLLLGHNKPEEGGRHRALLLSQLPPDANL